MSSWLSALLGSAAACWPSKKVVEAEIEDGEDLEEVVERNPVFALLHPRQIGLLDANLACQLGLGEMAFPPQRAQTGTHIGRGGRQLLQGHRHLGCRSFPIYSTIPGAVETLHPRRYI